MKNPMQPKWLAALLLPLSVAGFAADVHQHGHAEAAVVLEGDQLTVSFRAPLMDIFGSEQPPADASARLRYSKRLAQVIEPHPSAAALCELINVSSRSVADLFPESKAHDRDDHDHDHDHDDDSHEAVNHHQDIVHEWTFACEAPQQLQAVDLPFLSTFSSLTTDVVLLLPAVQSASRLAPGQTRILVE